MDISVLTEQRREMIIDLLKGMKIRKSDGEGFDKDDVYACMQQLCDVYEKCIDDLTVSYETEIGELQDKYQKYDENNDLYVSLIMEAKKSSNEIINKAKAEVDEILAAGKEQIAAQEEEIEQLRAAVAQETAELEAELETAKAAADQEKANLVAGIEAEKQHAEKIREQYRDQVSVMDQEFLEIKTNILRTAGKIDGLKAQLEETSEETFWTLQDEPVAPEASAQPSEPEDAPEEMTFEQLVSKLQQEEAADVKVAEVEAPAEPPVVEAEIEAPQEEETEGFHFEPTFEPIRRETETPAEPEGPFEEPALDIPEVDVPVEAPAEEPPADIPNIDIPFEEIGSGEQAEPKEEAVSDNFSLDSVLEEAKPEVAENGLGSIEDLALEEISVDIPQNAPAVSEEAPIEEISFEGLEELFKE